VDIHEVGHTGEDCHSQDFGEVQTRPAQHAQTLSIGRRISVGKFVRAWHRLASFDCGTVVPPRPSILVVEDDEPLGRLYRFTGLTEAAKDLNGEYIARKPVSQDQLVAIVRRCLASPSSMRR
jgi:hypothetical protein